MLRTFVFIGLCAKACFVLQWLAQLMPLKGKEGDVEEARKTNPVGVLRPEMVFEETEKNGYDCSTNQSHRKN